MSRAAARSALKGLLELLPGHLGEGSSTSKSFEARLARLTRHARRRRWVPAATALSRAATERRLAHELLAGSYVRLGDGVRQRVVSVSAMGDEGPDSLIERLFPPGTRATVPVALVMGERGTTFVARALERGLRASHSGVGLATRGRITIQGRPLDLTSIGRRKSADSLLGDPRVDAVVGAVSPRSVLAHGLGIARADVAVLIDPAPGEDRSLYEAALGVVLSAGPVTIVVGAHNPFREQLMRSDAAERLVVVAPRESDERASAHARHGGFVAHLARDGGGRRVELRKGGELVGSMPLAWHRPEAPAEPTGKERARALLASGAAFAVRLMDPATIHPSGWTYRDSGVITSNRR